MLLRQNIERAYIHKLHYRLFSLPNLEFVLIIGWCWLGPTASLFLLINILSIFRVTAHAPNTFSIADFRTNRLLKLMSKKNKNLDATQEIERWLMLITLCVDGRLLLAFNDKLKKWILSTTKKKQDTCEEKALKTEEAFGRSRVKTLHWRDQKHAMESEVEVN